MKSLRPIGKPRRLIFLRMLSSSPWQKAVRKPRKTPSELVSRKGSHCFCDATTRSMMKARFQFV